MDITSIDILESSYNLAAALYPKAVYEYMRKLRSQPFMRIGAFSDDGIEYFATTLKNWKRQINENCWPRKWWNFLEYQFVIMDIAMNPQLSTVLSGYRRSIESSNSSHFIPSPMTLPKNLCPILQIFLCFFYRFRETKTKRSLRFSLIGPHLRDTRFFGTYLRGHFYESLLVSTCRGLFSEKVAKHFIL